MAPMKKNRNRERKSIVRRRGKNSSRKGHKYSGSSDGSRVEKRTGRKINGYKDETAGIRSKGKHRRMGAGRYSKLARGGTPGSSDSGSHPRDKSGDIGTKRYIREALKFGLATGYLIPHENSGRQVLRVASNIMQLGGGGGASRSGSEGEADGSSIEGRGRGARGARSMGGGKRLNAGRSAKTGQKNIRKRGRSRTKSPKKSVALKRRRKQNVSRSKTKPRVQKRKRIAKVKCEEPVTRKKGAADEDEDDEDEDEEPDPDVEEDGDDKNDDTKKLPVSSRPASAVPDSDNHPPEGEKKGDDEPSDPSGEEGTDDDEEEEEEAEEAEEAEEGLEAENANPGTEEKKTEG